MTEHIIALFVAGVFILLAVAYIKKWGEPSKGHNLRQQLNEDAIFMAELKRRNINNDNDNELYEATSTSEDNEEDNDILISGGQIY